MGCGSSLAASLWSLVGVLSVSVMPLVSALFSRFLGTHGLRVTGSARHARHAGSGALQVKSGVISLCTWGIWNPPQGEAKRGNPEGRSGLRSALCVAGKFQRLMG